MSEPTSTPLDEKHEAAGARRVPRPEAPTTLAPLTFGDVPVQRRRAPSPTKTSTSTVYSSRRPTIIRPTRNSLATAGNGA